MVEEWQFWQLLFYGTGVAKLGLAIGNKKKISTLKAEPVLKYCFNVYDQKKKKKKRKQKQVAVSQAGQNA